MELDIRVHSTTGERPIDRFEEERELLTPLPIPPFISTRETLHKASWDYLISFGGSRYSVPWQYAGKQVWIRPSQGTRLTSATNAANRLVAMTWLPGRVPPTSTGPTTRACARACPSGSEDGPGKASCGDYCLIHEICCHPHATTASGRHL